MFSTAAVTAWCAQATGGWAYWLCAIGAFIAQCIASLGFAYDKVAWFGDTYWREILAVVFVCCLLYQLYLYVNRLNMPGISAMWRWAAGFMFNGNEYRQFQEMWEYLAGSFSYALDHVICLPEFLGKVIRATCLFIRMAVRFLVGTVICIVALVSVVVQRWIGITNTRAPAARQETHAELFNSAISHAYQLVSNAQFEEEFKEFNAAVASLKTLGTVKDLTLLVPTTRRDYSRFSGSVPVSPFQE